MRPAPRPASVLLLLTLSCGGAGDEPPAGAGAWGTAQLLGDGYEPRVAVDPFGGAVAVWKSGFPATLVARRFQRAAGWAAAEGLGGPTTGTADLEGDPAGNVLVAWNQREDDIWRVVVRRFEPAHGWTIPVVVSGLQTGDRSPDSFVTRPAVAVVPSGSAWIVWRQLQGADHRVWAVPFDPQAGFGPPLLVASGRGNTSLVRVDTDAVGNTVVVWRAFDGTARHVRAARFRIGQGWLPPETVASDPGLRDLSDNPPALAVSDGGDAFVVWAMPTDAGETGRVWAARVGAASGWEAPRQIGPDAAAAPGETPASLPRVEADALGAALAVWLQTTGPGGVHDVWSNRFTPGTGWEGPRRIGTEGGPAYPPALAMNASGAGAAAWFQGAPRPRVFSSRFLPAVGWGQPQMIDAQGDPFLPLAPDVGLDASGNALAVWWQATAGAAHVWANRFTASPSAAR